MMQNFSKSLLMMKQTHLHIGWPETEYISSKFSFLGELFLEPPFLKTPDEMMKWCGLHTNTN